jgi:hypothetical protein
MSDESKGLTGLGEIAAKLDGAGMQWVVFAGAAAGAAADAFPAVLDGAFGGAHQVSDAFIGVAICGQADDAPVSHNGVLSAAQAAFGVASRYARIEENSLQDLVG